MLPFTREQFLALFASYNQAIWPAQIVALLLGVSAVVIVLSPRWTSNRLVAAILATMWLWTGLAYHLLYFASINRAAYLFGALFLLQAALLAYEGIWRRRLRFGFTRSVGAAVGLAFAVYAMVLYPLIGLALGHAAMELPMFGVTPCPVAIFTFGLFLMTTRPVPTMVLIVPVIWSLIGGSAAILLDIPQDWLLLVSGVASAALLALRGQRMAGGESHP